MNQNILICNTNQRNDFNAFIESDINNFGQDNLIYLLKVSTTHLPIKVLIIRTILSKEIFQDTFG